MRAVFGLVLIVGIALAGGAVMMAKNYISAYQNELARERAAREAVVPTVQVMVANRPLRYGETLAKEDVRAVRWPETAQPEGTFVDMETLFPQDGEQRYIVRAMEKDEAILQIKVTEPGEDVGITSRLERGMRAFAIKVDVATGVSGFLRPGDRVDVYWTGSTRGVAENSRAGEITKLIQTNIQLIAIDQSAGDDIDGTVIARTVTVAAAPQQVAALAQAQTTAVCRWPWSAPMTTPLPRRWMSTNACCWASKRRPLRLSRKRPECVRFAPAAAPKWSRS